MKPLDASADIKRWKLGVPARIDQPIPPACQERAAPAAGREPAAPPADRLDLDRAVNGLRRKRPDLSAGEPMWAWQKTVLALVLPTIATLAAFAPDQAVSILAASLVLPFFCVVALRTAALWHTAFHRQATTPSGAPSRSETTLQVLPRYSLLIPLYDEAPIIPDLVAALGAIDYPIDLIEALLIVEAADLATRDAIASAALPPQVRCIVVPEGEPRTKPRALNYALPQTAGECIVVYDAEDMPEPDQLRRAAALLAANPGLGCVQARLNVLNAEETWLTRQFAIEYTVLFDCILPTLDHLRLPVPLGGTSNHFSKAVLEEVGGWDPFNVTEDADLGIRLARAGREVKVLNSTTWEEAPAQFGTWLKQRTRWLKGWMQTYLVHMRRPLQTARDLGLLRFLGLQVLMGGLILSTLVHPWFYVVAVLEATMGPLATGHHDTLSDAVKVIGITNLVLGYASGVALGCVAVVGRGRRGLAVWALLMPVYWLLISLAAYRAMVQLASTPYRWEKTRHRPRAEFLHPNPAE